MLFYKELGGLFALLLVYRADERIPLTASIIFVWAVSRLRISFRFGWAASIHDISI